MQTIMLRLLAARLLSGVAIVAAASGATAQTTPAQAPPNFVDTRPLPQSDRARADEAEAKRRADEELKRLSADADLRRKTDDDAKRAIAELEAKRRAEDEAKRLAADAEAKRVAAETDAKRRADEDAKRVATDADAKRRADEDAKRVAAEADAKRRADAARTATTNSPAAQPGPETTRLLTRGRQLMAEGDIIGARLVLDRAATAGNAEAATALAATYDAAELQRIGAVGVAGDPVIAAQWRKRAMELGAATTPSPASASAEAEQQRQTAAQAAAAEAERKRQADAAMQRQASDAQTAAPRAAAPPAAVAPAAPPVAAGAQRLLDRGRLLLTTGDIDAARLFFERAAAAGAPEGTLELAGTYDPNALQELGVVGLQGDAARAIALYRQAHAKGVGAAAARLQRLGQQP